MENKYASLSTLQVFLENLKNLFAIKSDIQDQLDDITSHMFVGTYAEYQIAYANGKIALNAIVVITDDENNGSSSGGGSGGDSSDSSASTSSLLGTGALGYMILG